MCLYGEWGYIKAISAHVKCTFNGLGEGVGQQDGYKDEEKINDERN
jgi:hypothetical protein